MPDPLDFVKVFRQAARNYQGYARVLHKECAAAGVAANTEFWIQASQDAQRAADIVTQCRRLHLSAPLITFALRGLVPFQEAYATQDIDLLRVSMQPGDKILTLSAILEAEKGPYTKRKKIAA